MVARGYVVLSCEHAACHGDLPFAGTWDCILGKLQSEGWDLRIVDYKSTFWEGWEKANTLQAWLYLLLFSRAKGVVPHTAHLVMVYSDRVSSASAPVRTLPRLNEALQFAL